MISGLVEKLTEASCCRGWRGISPGLCSRNPGASGKELVLVFFFMLLKDYAIKTISLVLLIERNYYLTHNRTVAIV